MGHTDNIYGFILALEVFSEFMPDGLQETNFLESEHDIIYSHISNEQIPKDSENGMMLSDLGWHLEDEVWAYFT
mgnify:CR=1 FL=1